MAKHSVITNVVQESNQSQSLIARADEFIATLRQLLTQQGQRWHAPTLSHNEIDNSIEISWWRASKSLIFTLEPETPTAYLKAWGTNIHSDMEEGVNPSPAQLTALWQWLYA